MDANVKAIKADANQNAKALVDYLRRVGLIGESVLDGDGHPATLREYRGEHEEVLHNAALAACDLARRIATL